MAASRFMNPNEKKPVTAVFGVPIEGIGVGEVLSRVSSSQKPTWIVTANPEILLQAKRDPSYAMVLSQAGIRTVDGIGLWLCLRLSGRSTSRLTGVELADALIKVAHDNKWRVGLLGGAPGVAARAAEYLKSKFPTLSVLAEDGGSVRPDGTDDDRGEEARYRMTMFGPQILLVALSFPGQECWIARHMSEFPDLRAVVGVGGTFDFWSGSVRRAPPSLRRLGLEWLWRLSVEPRRWKRIWRAVVVFPTVFILDRFSPRKNKSAIIEPPKQNVGK